jgi:hypothetical protein
MSMSTEEWIPAEEFCSNYQIEYSFISTLFESGLIEVTTFEEKSFIPVGQLKDLETFTRLHYDLDINIEGIEAIAHLLKKVHDLQQEIVLLKNQVNQQFEK